MAVLPERRATSKENKLLHARQKYCEYFLPCDAEIWLASMSEIVFTVSIASRYSTAKWNATFTTIGFYYNGFRKQE